MGLKQSPLVGLLREVGDGLWYVIHEADKHR